MKRFLFVFLFSLFFITDLFAGTSTYKVESKSVLNVREQPSTSATVLGVLNTNQKIEVYSIQDGWAQISYNGKRGFVSAKYITPTGAKKEKFFAKIIDFVKGAFEKNTSTKTSKSEKTNHPEKVSNPKFEKAKNSFMLWVDKKQNDVFVWQKQTTKSLGNTNWTLWIIVPFVLLFFYLRDDIYILDSFRVRFVYCAIVLVISVFEILYALGIEAFFWQEGSDSIFLDAIGVVAFVCLFAGQSYTQGYIFCVTFEDEPWVFIPAILLVVALVGMMIFGCPPLIIVLVMGILLLIQCALVVVYEINDTGRFWSGVVRGVVFSLFFSLFFFVTYIMLNYVAVSICMFLGGAFVLYLVWFMFEVLSYSYIKEQKREAAARAILKDRRGSFGKIILIEASVTHRPIATITGWFDANDSDTFYGEDGVTYTYRDVFGRWCWSRDGHWL